MDPASSPPAVTAPSEVAANAVVYTPPRTPRSPAARRPSHGRNRSVGDWWKSLVAPSTPTTPTPVRASSPAVFSPQTPFSPAHLSAAVAEERASRSGHTPGPTRLAVPRTGLLFEFAAFVAMATSSTAPTGTAPAPTLLWAWPDVGPARHIHYLEHFCLPACGPLEAGRTFVFAVSAETNASERLLCCCLLLEPGPAQPAFMQPTRPRSASGHRRSLSTGVTTAYSRDGGVAVEAPGSPRCLVLVTRYPYVPLAMHVLRGVAADPVGTEALALLARCHVTVPEPFEVLRVDAALSWSRVAEAPEAEERYLLEWCAPPAMRCLARVPAFMATLVSAVLLERSLVLHSTSLETLTAVCFALMAMVRPFAYQAVFLPVVPPVLGELLQAPVPFVVGLHSSVLDAARAQLVQGSGEALVVALDAGTVCDAHGKAQRVLPLPRQALLLREQGLEQRCAQALKGGLPEALEVVACWRTFWDDTFGDFRKHCFRDMTHPEEPVTVFVRDAFVEEMQGRPGGRDCAPWLEAFFNTQLWAAHSDEKRTQLDLQRRNSVLSARMVSDFHRSGGFAPRRTQ